MATFAPSERGNRGGELGQRCDLAVGDGSIRSRLGRGGGVPRCAVGRVLLVEVPAVEVLNERCTGTNAMGAGGGRCHPAVVDLDDAELASLRAGIVGGMPLVVDDLTAGDLDDIAWSGGSTHVGHVAEALSRVDSGEVEYLAVRSPAGRPLAIGGVDYAKHVGAGTIWQLVTHPALRSLGLGGGLLDEAERRIAARGLRWAVLAVEVTNRRALALYRRRGYEAYGQDRSSWLQEDAAGDVYTHHAELLVLRLLLTR